MGWALSKLFLDFWNFFNFAKPLNRRTFVLNSTLIVFVEYSFSQVPLPYNKFHVKRIEIGTFISGWRFEVGSKMCVLLNCGQQSQFSKVRREFDSGRVNLDHPMTCAGWPVAGNLTLFQTQTIGKLKPWHRPGREICFPNEFRRGHYLVW